MVSSRAETVEEYLAELPDDRRDAVAEVRDVILENLPDGFVEAMNWGMISYEVPLRVVPETYNGEPLMYAALASQKQKMSLYLTGVYGDETLRQRFVDAYRSTGKRLDMGKSCVRFKTADDLPLDAIGQLVGGMSLDRFIATYEVSRKKR